MLNFTTLFDSNYLSRGLAMYYSLEENCNDFHLYIFAFDDLSYEILKDLKLQYATIISLKEFENPELLKVKSTRSKAEYCWTCTPSTIDYVINNFNVGNCTYLDADLIFYDDPEKLTNELVNEKNVLITEHRYAKTTDIYEQNRAGRFCVQFVTFNNTESSKKVLHTWRDQCIDWCYARYEDGKFGDQKYLDSWPEKYHNVHILEHLGGGLAPWNVSQYKFVKNGKLFGIDKKSLKKFDIIFYHFHFVRFYKNGFVDIGWHLLPKMIKKYIYIPYINKIKKIEIELQEKYTDYKPFIYPSNIKTIKDLAKKIFKRIFRYNLIKIK